MIKSMTGFGKGESTFENKTIVLEIRTLNSKNLDINIRIPNNYKELEALFRKEIADNLKRGKIDFIFHEKTTNLDSISKINSNIVKDYISQLTNISSNTESDLLPIAMRLPGVINNEKDAINNYEKQEILALLENTLKQVNTFRSQEGKIILKDFNNRIQFIKNHLKSISKIDKNRVKSIKEKLKNSLNDFKLKIDENRLEQELIYYIEKLDITEEMLRLSNHINYFKECLDSDNSNGKKLGFITQEMGREINTIGSKANSFELQKIVVQMKDELEKIKEQLLNVL